MYLVTSGQVLHVLNVGTPCVKILTCSWRQTLHNTTTHASNVTGLERLNFFTLIIKQNNSRGERYRTEKLS